MGRNAGFCFLPFRRLRHAVVDAEHIVAPFLEAGRAVGDVVFVVQPFVHPDVHDRDRQRRVGARLDRNPAAAEELRGRIKVRINVDELDAEFLGPHAPLRALEARGVAVGDLRVARPEDDHLGFLQAVLDEAVEAGHADAHRIAVVVRRAPVPAFPAVRVVVHAREAEQIAEAQRARGNSRHCPTGDANHADRDRSGPMDLALALDLVGDDVERLIPADADVAGHAPVLGVARPVRVEVDALHRVEDALVGIDHRLQGQRVRIDARAPVRRERLSARADDKLGASLSSRSIGVMRRILPSFT